MTDSNLYLILHPDSNKELLPNSIPIWEISKWLPAPDKSKFFYHINRLTNIPWLYIPPSMAPDILTVTHEEGHLGFSCWDEIIICSWFICSLIKLLCVFICHYPQCLVAFQTSQNPLYGSLQLIESPPIPLFTLILDFVLALPLSKEKYNAIMSVTCKFSKWVTLIKNADT